MTSGLVLPPRSSNGPSELNSARWVPSYTCNTNADNAMEGSMIDSIWSSLKESGVR